MAMKTVQKVLSLFEVLSRCMKVLTKSLMGSLQVCYRTEDDQGDQGWRQDFASDRVCILSYLAIHIKLEEEI